MVYSHTKLRCSTHNINFGASNKYTSKSFKIESIFMMNAMPDFSSETPGKC